MAQLYTRMGDDGFTSLLGEGRVAKYTLQPEAYGTVDEANAAMGIARAAAQSPRTRELLLAAQRDLYHMMAELAATQQVAHQFRKIDEKRVGWLEQSTDEITALIQLPKEFVVPGDSLPAAYLDLARTIVRRAERVVVRLLHDGIIENVELVRYLNRLSSLLFVLALYENALAGVNQVTLAKQ
ncbi:MAG: cob(I)yrinic acid a,c-diamide adenosyltransferase [Anaerolineae bacterium]|nr:cob(I)yrinic acid a,c-diamide adenosyltransferase [Thermoflexales bacterium]MDW8394694.1 cob(I)yrinic acid a,c-diamide adenosyltransferase [Anaerolineae bacterium]